MIFRSNIVTLTEPEPYAQKTILDHSSGEISTADADILMDAIRTEFNSDTFRFYTGTSYRHILVWKHVRVSALEPPHDHLGKVIGDYLPQEKVLRDMMERSFDILNNHPPQPCTGGCREAQSQLPVVLGRRHEAQGAEL